MSAAVSMPPERSQSERARIRVRGYFLACARDAAKERRTLEVAVSEMVRIRAVIDAHQERTLWLLEQAELAARVVASDDEAWIAEVAGHLEECFG